MPIEEGKTAPAFSLPDQDGKTVSLADFKGKKNVVLYFYPKDDTPGCTKEACGFRDLGRDFARLDTVVLGVSADSGESHLKFIAKYKLPFTLLSDVSKKVMERYGAWGEKRMYGQKKIGVIRSSVVIGTDGKVLKHWKKVPQADVHPEKVLAALGELL